MIPCCPGLEECLWQWEGPGSRHYYRCLPACPTTATTTATTTTTGESNSDVNSPYRLLTINVWWRNVAFDAIAYMIAVTVDAEIVNIQEAVGETPGRIIEALNRLNRGTWALGNGWSESWYWCGLNAYRSDLWSLEWRKEVPVVQEGDVRGVCGVRLRRRADSKKVCAWGAHPVWRSGGISHWATDAISRAADAMRECSSSGAPSVFMCDCNTFDHDVVRRHLEASTGWTWATSEVDGYDQIFAQTGPRDLGRTGSGGAICPDCGERGCQAGCSNPGWAYSDHPPVYVNVTGPRHASLLE